MWLLMAWIVTLWRWRMPPAMRAQLPATSVQQAQPATLFVAKLRLSHSPPSMRPCLSLPPGIHSSCRACSLFWN
ncbi:unnamed protein product, partial [Phaeothamnion confervicola]